MFVIPSTQSLNFSATGNLANGLNKIDTEKISLYTANQPRLTINADGNIGIGTTNPTEKLHIVGDLKVTGNLDLASVPSDFNVGGDLTVNGDLTIQGTTTNIDSTTLTVDDSIIRLADNNPADITDIGFYGMYIDGGVTKFRGMIHDTSANAWKFFDNETNEPSDTTANIQDANLLMTLIDGGNVGIGTNTPTEKLHIADNSGARIHFSNDTTGHTGSDGFVVGTAGNNIAQVWQYENTAMQIATNNTEHIRIQATGLVGIGNNAPTAKLTIQASGDESQGETNSSHALRITTGTDEQSIWMGYDATDDIGYINAAKSGSSQPICLQTRGSYVGIGITNPSFPLHLYGSSNIIFEIESSDDNAAIFLNSNSGGTGLGINRESRIYFQEESITKSVLGYDPDIGGFGIGMGNLGSISTDFFISDAKNVGIGTDAPADLLHIYGNSTASITGLVENSNTGTGAFSEFRVRSSGGDLALITLSSGFTTSSIFHQDGSCISTNSSLTGGLSIATRTTADIRLYTNDTERMRILSGGNVGIGTTNPSQLLHLEGSNPQLLLSNAGGGGSIYFGNSAHGVGRGTLLTNFTNGNDVVLYTAGATGGAGLQTAGGFVYLSAGGNLGIGTFSTTYELHIHDDTNDNVYLQFTQASTGTTSTDGFIVGIDSLERARIQNRENTDMLFYTNDNLNMTLSAAGALSKTSGSFDIPHPIPEMKEQNYRLRHHFVESPNEGDNIYRYHVEATENNQIINIDLPDYFPYLNQNPQIWVNAAEHFGRGFGKLNDENTILSVHCETTGKYNVLLIGTRKDEGGIEIFNEKRIVWKSSDGTMGGVVEEILY